MSVLDYAAKYKFDTLYNRFQAGRDVIATYEKDPPYAYFIPQKQHDPVAAVEMLRRLAFNGIEIRQLTRPIVHEGISHPIGTWVIPMQQPFANFVRQLMEVQEYPDLRVYPEGPPDTPYDVSGWTLPYQFGVKVLTVTEPLTDDIKQAMGPVSGPAPVAWNDANAQGSLFDSPPGIGYDTDSGAAAILPPSGAIRGSGGSLVLDPAQLNVFKALNQAWEAGARISYVPGSGGKYVATGVADRMSKQWADQLYLQIDRSRTGGTSLSKTRIGLFRPWSASMDEGWTRLLMEQYGFEFNGVRNADIRAGDLKGRYDVLIFADMRGGSIMNGFQPGSMPPRYEGGIGDVGVKALDEFVQQGGTIVCLNGSCQFAIDQFNLPVSDVSQGLRPPDYFMSGSILAATVDPSHPVMAGMPEEAQLVVSRSPVGEVPGDRLAVAFRVPAR
jgi:hypothetical protein